MTDEDLPLEVQDGASDLARSEARAGKYLGIWRKYEEIDSKLRDLVGAAVDGLRGEVDVGDLAKLIRAFTQLRESDPLYRWFDNRVLRKGGGGGMGAAQTRKDVAKIGEIREAVVGEAESNVVEVSALVGGDDPKDIKDEYERRTQELVQESLRDGAE